MLTLLKIILMAGAGVALGLGATALAVWQGLSFGAVRAGPWTAWPRNGTPEIDPYARAALARSGETPLGLAEGLGLLARKDDGGEWLVGRCDYVVTGHIPAARFWTLSVADPNGFLISHPLLRYGVTSSEVIRQQDGRFAIVLSAHARAGNWLPLGHDKRFVLALRLYDTVISASAEAIEPGTLPTIERKACR